MAAGVRGVPFGGMASTWLPGVRVAGFASGWGCEERVCCWYSGTRCFGASGWDAVSLVLLLTGGTVPVYPWPQELR